jgi:hypothetical protein
MKLTNIRPPLCFGDNRIEKHATNALPPRGWDYVHAPDDSLVATLSTVSASESGHSHECLTLVSTENQGLARSAENTLAVLTGDEPVFFGRRAKSVRMTLQRLAAKGNDGLEVR